MTDPQETYTYRAGQKVVLKKEPDQFVVRALPEQLEEELGVIDAEQMSSNTSLVTVRATDLEVMMSQARHIAPTHHAYRMAETDEEFLITDRIFVTFREALPPEQVDEFAARYSLVLLEKYSERDYLFQLTDHTGMNPVKLVVKLMEEEPLVELADHDLNYRVSTYEPLSLPTDPAYAQQWHLHTRFQDAQFDPRCSSCAEDAWQLLGNFGSPEVVVAVTDDGCKLDHADFDSPGKFAGWGYLRGSRLITNVDIEADPAEMYKTGSNHGTSCAGVIAGEADAVLTVGAAPGCRLLPIQWESEGPSLFISDSKMMTVLAYLADKVDVVSSSWGRVPTNVRIPLLRNRIAELAQTGGRRGRGIIFLWAAGNENCPIQHTGTVDIPYTNGVARRPDGSLVWVGVQTSKTFQNNLTDVPGVMHVAALASTARRSHYSNYGTGVTLCAPTNNVHTYRRMIVPGLGVTTTTGLGGGLTSSFGGTSSATPLVAGVAALVISANPELTALEVISILKQTASKDLNLEGYSPTPPSSFDQDTSWDVSPIFPADFTDTGDPDGTWSPWFGHGRVDAQAAVAEALRRRGEATTRQLQFSSSPNLDIPDNDPAGIRDIIHIPDSGRVQDIKVSLDISHTWIGDLIVHLIAPDSTDVLLHNRAGGGRDNIQETHDLRGLPVLASLREKSLAGDWTLHVQDMAKRDKGVLKSWSLDLQVTTEPVQVEDVAAVQIPDRNTKGITRTLDLPAGHTIRDIAVSVDITHTWIGDLQVTLIPPDKPPIRLFDRTGEGADNLLQTWHSQDVPALRELRGQEAGGAWRLNVADLASRDVGKLNRWGIEIVE